jgi:hypothetical protein
MIASEPPASYRFVDDFCFGVDCLAETRGSSSWKGEPRGGDRQHVLKANDDAADQ